ncbi:magnesium and cobalt transport protein CorA [Spongisporangium articulatum]|uniref:Magnesium and cobalt transport protein CorA n=1 Tax=Spongisporangium articulatum TaxID=3362603 RepID=A0ABW8AQ09_9ACTN
MARNPLNPLYPSTRPSLPMPLAVLRPAAQARKAAVSSKAVVEVPKTDALLDAAVDWALYRDGLREYPDDFEQAVKVAREGEGFVWLGLHEPSTEQLDELGAVFNLHPLALEDAASPNQRPKVERHESDIFVAIRTLAYVDSVERHDGGDLVETGTIMVFVGDWFVVTIRHGRHASMSGLRRRLEQNEDQLALGPSAVLHAVTDKVVDDYLAVVDAIQEDIEELERQVFAPRGGTDIERIYQLKRDIIEAKRTVWPLAAPLRELAERPRRMIHPDIREYFRDVDDHLARVHEQIAAFDELLTSMLQAGLARVAVAENEDMRKISAWVAIAAVPTMIAGIYGMNFQHMPGQSSPWGYPSLMVAMAGVCLFLWRGFKRNGWL